MEMGWEIITVLGILLATIILFATEKYPVDLTSMMALGALLVVGLIAPHFSSNYSWLTVEECFSGFSSEATITVAAMFVLSAGLQKTGSVDALGRGLIRLGHNQTILLVLVMVSIAVVSAFVNNTAAVAVFIPLVLAVCVRHKVSPAKLLIPLSFASQFGGVCTLVGSSTNLLVHSISLKHGLGGFTMFEFTEMGMIFMGVGIIYFLVAGRWILPAGRADQLTEAYQLREYITEVRILKGSPLIDKTVLQSRLGQSNDVTVLEILRDKKKIWSPLQVPLREGDVLLLRGGIKELMALKAPNKLEIEPEFQLRDETLETEDLVLVEGLVPPRSRLTGRNLVDIDFRRRYNAIVLAIQRRGHTLTESLNKIRLRVGDALLIQGHKDEIARLRKDDNFVVLEEVAPPALRRHKVPVALAIIALTVGLAAFTVMPIVVSAILGAIAMITTRVISLEEAYTAVDWKVIVLLAGVLPLGLALERTGAATVVADYALEYSGRYGFRVVLGVFYALTVVATSVMSNNAAAVLLAPIAISIAQALGVSEKPFLLAVLFAASTCFATPVGYQTNVMVYNPGGYRFTDFMKVGIPLNILFCIVAIYYIPEFWPF